MSMTPQPNEPTAEAIEAVLESPYSLADWLYSHGWKSPTDAQHANLTKLHAAILTQLAALRAENERLKAGDTYYHRYNETLERLSDSMDENRHLRAEWEVRESQLRASLSTAVDFLADYHEAMPSVHVAKFVAQQRPLLAGKPPISDDGNGVVRKPPLTSQDYSKKASTNSGAMEPDAANVANSQCDPAAHCITRPSSDYSAQPTPPTSPGMAGKL